MGWNLEIGPYFLTGLPRSRTAWFSEWLPTCLHEGMNGCYSHNEYIKKLGSGGDSSSGLVYFPIERYFPHAPVVIVERDIDEVMESSIRIGRAIDDTYIALTDIQNRLKGLSGLRVDFHNLNLEEIWNHLIGHGFDNQRAIRMSLMNIQKIDKYLDIEAFKSFLGEL